MAKKAYSYVIRNGKPVAVPLPKGSVDGSAEFKENMLGAYTKAALGRVFGGKR